VSEPLWLSLEPAASHEAPAPTLVDGAQRVEVGHLSGWGQGHLSPGQSIVMPRSAGSSDRWRRSFIVAGPGRLTVRVESSRVGSLCVDLTISPSG
jgi:hypothetical protein